MNLNCTRMWFWSLLNVIALANGITWSVVEYQPLHLANFTSEENVLFNVQNYINILGNLTTKVDLIVFPESTLSVSSDNLDNILSVNEATPTPCLTPDVYPSHISVISCAAITYETFIVVNVVTKVPCDTTTNLDSENCQKIGFFLYNTDVVFDREGTIVQWYHKYNLFGEKSLDKPKTSEVKYFTVDNEQVGLFTCFDLLFNTPIGELLSSGIKIFAFPTMWFSELPFLTGLQAQQMWALKHNVTLLAAEANNPLRGSGGSGIYYGDKGPAILELISEGGSKAIVSSSNEPEILEKVDPDVLGPQLDNVHLITDDSINDLTTEALDLSSKTSSELTLCHRNSTFCCHLSMSFSTSSTEENKTPYTYHLAVFQGVRSFTGMYNGGLELCGIIACLNETQASCGQKFPKYSDVAWPVTLTSVTLKATFESDAERVQFPNTLLSTLRPMRVEDLAWSEVRSGNVTEVTFTSNQPQDRLLTFAIYGRNFAWDSEPYHGNTSGGVKAHFGLFCGALLLICLNK